MGFSSAFECLRNFHFGGHHGLVILSLADSAHMLRSTRQCSGSVLVLGPVLSMILAGSAALCALVELTNDLRPGSHHDVAILAIAHLVENVERTRRNRLSASKAA